MRSFSLASAEKVVILNGRKIALLTNGIDASFDNAGKPCTI